MGRNWTKLLLTFITILSMLFSQPVSAQGTGTSASDEINLDYLKSVMEMIKERHKGDVTDRQLIEGALRGMFDTMDQYTTYYTPEEADSFLRDINGTYEGIGVLLNKRDDYVIILKVYPLSPAEKAGIMPGDKIASVDGKDVAGAPLEEVSAITKGPAGTKVILGIIRSGKPGVINIEVVRGEIKLSPVTYEIKGDIGYIKLDVFNANADEYITKALDDMDKNNINKIVLDLRNNPGGDVEQAVAVARKLVPRGLITRLDFKSESVSDREYYSELDKIKYDLAVLVNGMSASASEIVAGAIQDTKAGTIIGTKTFGKAKVQSIIPLLTPEAYKKYEKQLGTKIVDAYDLITKYKVMPRKSEIIGWTKITTGMYTTPKGRMIDESGITPDIVVEDPVTVKDIDIGSIQKLTATWKPDLNNEGVDVYNAEKILKLLGYDVDTPDFKLDEKTFKAVSKFRIDSGLYPGGTLDFTTQRALNDRLDKKILEVDRQYNKAVEVLSK